MIQAPRGTQDILPAEQLYWSYVRAKAAETARVFGYARIDTPTFEETRLFMRTAGEGTDIVEKEMYSFPDHGGGLMTLRPEGTAPVCRAYIEHGMASLPQPVKLYYVTSIFRYERPQAGRFREHHQVGFEAIGEPGAALDAEVVATAWHLFVLLGLKGLTLQINNIGCPECRPTYLAALKDHFRNLPLCADCQVRLDKNTLRLLDCKNPACAGQAQAAPRSSDYLCPECQTHFSELRRQLDALDLPYHLNHNLVRGLDYYTRTVFEIQPEVEAGQSTIAGGGRYDGLIETLGGKPTPGVGFATGMERIVLNLKRQNVVIPPISRPSAFLIWMGDTARIEAFRLTAALRESGVSAVTVYSPRSLKAQLRQADALGCRYAVIIGEDELARGVVGLRDLQNSSQQEMQMSELADSLK